MSSYRISKSKKFKVFKDIEPSDKLSLEKWRAYVDNDPELTWAEDSRIAESYRQHGKVWVEESRYRIKAYFDERKKDGYAGLRIHYTQDNFLYALSERLTLRRIEKLWAITQFFEGYLHKNGIRYTEKKLNKVRERYNKKEDDNSA